VTKNLKKTLFLLALLPLLLLSLKLVNDLRKGAAGTPANIFVDVKSPQGSVPTSLWQNLAQGGEENKDMIAPVLNQIRTLSPQYIRLDHIYDFFNVYQGPGNYNFTDLDQAVSTILSTGAKPMLALSYTPPSLAQNGSLIDPPRDWTEWQNLIRATVQHYSGKDQQNIKDVYYEVWNEPDLFGNWHYGKDPNYQTLYYHSVKGAQSALNTNPFKIGGPAITAFYENWFKALFKFAHENGLRMDFVSWHKYSKNPQDYEDDFEKLSQILTDYPEYFNIERLITEFGPNSEPDPWYDNQLGAAHFLSLATRLSGRVHRLFTFEIKDGPQERDKKSSGWGLLTHESKGAKPKPRYQALQLLNQLKGQRLMLKGEGSWVTGLAAQNGSTTQLLLVNYDPQGKHHESVPVYLRNLDPGTYQITTTSFPGKTTTSQTVIDTNFYVRQLPLAPNSALLLELKKL
jgi:hypothetical protein